MDSFEAEAMGILQGIKDDTVREMLLKQMKALYNLNVNFPKN